MIDTHSHLYLPQFDQDYPEAIQRAQQVGVKAILLPNIDMASIGPMIRLTQEFPGYCLPMAGLHPTNVKSDYKIQLAEIEKIIVNQNAVAIGETGIDLYWDASTFEYQVAAFKQQIEWSLLYNLPLVIHARNSLNQIFEVLNQYKGLKLRGVFHCFSGKMVDVEKIISLGMHFGIGGVVTFKNAKMEEIVKNIPNELLLVETDSPYLAPVPYRGQRNESSYLTLIVRKISEIKNQDVSQIVTQNAIDLFRLPIKL